jgi:hypothetical protein
VCGCICLYERERKRQRERERERHEPLETAPPVLVIGLSPVDVFFTDNPGFWRYSSDSQVYFKLF